VKDEFDIEPVPGLPAQLPEGERLLWQGSPGWKGIALRVFHIRGVAAYFVLLALWRLFVAAYEGRPVASAMPAATFYLALGFIVIGFFVFFAWWIARTTIYSITSKRIIMRFGVALPMTVNLPFAAIEKAALRPDGKGGGDIAIATREGHRAAWAMLWPHLRPWRFRSPEPMLRALTDGPAAATIFAQAFSAAVDGAAVQTIIEPQRVKPGLPGLAPAAG
jgi:hypothetical protein